MLRYPAHWAVATTRTRSELVAAENLKAQGFTYYLPMFVNHVTQRPQVLFPGYIFVLVVDRWRALRSTIGVVSLLMSEDGARPAELRAHEMAGLRARENSDGYLVLEPFCRGQPVVVGKGAMKDKVGLFDGMTVRDRCRVLMNMIGQSTRVEVSVRDLIAA
jgi:transcription antitermination factor NusG